MFEVMTKCPIRLETHLIQPMTVIWSNRPSFIFVKLNFNKAFIISMVTVGDFAGLIVHKL